MNKRCYIFLTAILLVQNAYAEPIEVDQTQKLEIKDIQFAIIEDDVQKAQVLSRQLLSTELKEDQVQEVTYLLSLSLIKTNDIDQAVEMLTELKDQETISDVLRDKVYLALVDCYYILGFYEKSLEVLGQLVKVSPQTEMMALVFLKRARSHLKLAQWEQARDFLERIVKDYPHSFEMHTAKQLLQEKNYFAVQIGAFIEQERAEVLANEMRKNNEYAYVIETKDLTDQTFYRVRVGQLTKLDDAKQLKSKLTSQGYPARIYP